MRLIHATYTHARTHTHTPRMHACTHTRCTDARTHAHTCHACMRGEGRRGGDVPHYPEPAKPARANLDSLCAQTYVLIPLMALMCVCVCVCVCIHTHTQTSHTSECVYTSECVCVCAHTLHTHTAHTLQSMHSDLYSPCAQTRVCALNPLWYLPPPSSKSLRPSTLHCTSSLKPFSPGLKPQTF